MQIRAQELKAILAIVEEGLKSISDSLVKMVGKINAVAQVPKVPSEKPKAPRTEAEMVKPSKAKTLTAKTLKPQTPTKKVAKKSSQNAVPAPKVKQKKKEKTSTLTHGDSGTAYDVVLKIINGAENGIGPAAIMEKTGFNKKKVSNIIHRLKQRDQIMIAKRGVYKKK